MNLLTFVFLLALVSASEYYEDEDDYEDYATIFVKGADLS